MKNLTILGPYVLLRMLRKNNHLMYLPELPNWPKAEVVAVGNMVPLEAGNRVLVVITPEMFSSYTSPDGHLYAIVAMGSIVATINGPDEEEETKSAAASLGLFDENGAPRSSAFEPYITPAREPIILAPIEGPHKGEFPPFIDYTYYHKVDADTPLHRRIKPA